MRERARRLWGVVGSRALEALAIAGERALKFPSFGGCALILAPFFWICVLISLPELARKGEPSVGQAALDFANTAPPVSWIRAPLMVDPFDQARKAALSARWDGASVVIPFGRVMVLDVEAPSQAPPWGADPAWRRVDLSVNASGGAARSDVEPEEGGVEPVSEDRALSNPRDRVEPRARLGVAVELAPEDYKIQGSSLWMRLPRGSRISLSLASLSASGAFSALPSSLAPSCESKSSHCVVLATLQTKAVSGGFSALSHFQRFVVWSAVALFALWAYKTRLRRYCRAGLSMISPSLAAAWFPLSAPNQEIFELAMCYKSDTLKPKG